VCRLRCLVSSEREKEKNQNNPGHLLSAPVTVSEIGWYNLYANYSVGCMLTLFR